MLRVRVTKPAVPSTSTLLDQWVEAKADEAAANARRKAIEEQLCLTFTLDQEAGSKTFHEGSRRITRRNILNVSGKALLIAEAAKPLRWKITKPALDSTAILAKREDPKFDLLIAAGLVIRPGSPQFEVVTIPG